MALSPMMHQYNGIKSEYSDCILFFRLGDFYEMFYEDAKIASRELDLVLTGKNCGTEERAPMCGVPYHASENYIAKLVDRGYKVAICEQVEDPATAKGLVKREVVRIITPGTVLSGAMLSEKENNYLASCFVLDKGIGLAYCDISTGELLTTEFSGPGAIDALVNELVKINASEVLINQKAASNFGTDMIADHVNAFINVIEEKNFDLKVAEEAIKEQFKSGSMLSLGLQGMDLEIGALGALLKYIKDTQKSGTEHINKIKSYKTGNHMALDKATIRNLELTENLFDRCVKGSLLGILDKCHTAMGSRKLKKWLREPLNDLEEINERLDSVELLVDEIILRNNIKEYLKQVYDLERLAGRISFGNANARDMIALRNSIYGLPDIKLELCGVGDVLLERLAEDIHTLEDVYLLIDKAVEEDSPLTMREGGLIKVDFSDELDSLKASIKDGQQWIASLEGIERERTGIKNLKVGFNKVFGYYLEVTKSYYDQIPEDYIRKQTLVNCERFITPQLKEMESIVLGAEAKINELEYKLFTEIRAFIQGYIPDIQKTADAIAAIDALCSYAQVSSQMNYVKPTVHEGSLIKILKGRHPVIERTIKNGIFVANDTFIDDQEATLLLITGPNMSGKSTYMRQTALIVLMAQAGCFVPCESAEIGICDRIFTRIGANDNLSQGQSTFFVEMSELAYILNNATNKSLIILDEIGRGTSTYDGLSIAWAAAEYLLSDKLRARTMFATHYHEMTALEGKLKGFKNLNVDVKDDNGTVVFLHTIVEGSASRSYGIHVAKLAGVPEDLLNAADIKLKELEKNKV